MLFRSWRVQGNTLPELQMILVLSCHTELIKQKDRASKDEDHDYSYSIYWARLWTLVQYS